ncbi:hypothetical protein [Bradyrhizobium sp.]|uniref:hypothetical protein n=1 Tax=Bradyrhizobium sp. TaxID=376 RepID=UPI0039E269FE
MHADWKLMTGAVALLAAATLMLPTNASAITVEVAKKCNGLVEKQFPPRQPANPAAGSAKGSGQAQREFFKKCVDNGGNVDTTPEKTDK